MNREQRRKIQSKAERVWSLSQRIDALGGMKVDEAATAIKNLTDYTRKLSLEDLILIDEYIIEKYGTAS